MRTSIFTCAFMLLLGTIAGCAGGGMEEDTGPVRPDVPFTPMDAPFSAPDVPIVPPDVPPPDAPVIPPDVPRDVGRACTSIPCTTDGDCLSCGASSGNSNCCDTSVGRCYIYTGGMCPPPAADGGMSMY